MFSLHHEDPTYAQKCKLSSMCDTLPPTYSDLALPKAFQIPMSYNDMNNKVKQAFSYVRFLMASKEELDTFLESNFSISEINPVSYANEKRVLEEFAKTAQQGLEGFPHSLEDDRARLADRESYPLFSNERNIVLMR